MATEKATKELRVHAVTGWAITAIFVSGLAAGTVMAHYSTTSPASAAVNATTTSTTASPKK